MVEALNTFKSWLSLQIKVISLGFSPLELLRALGPKQKSKIHENPVRDITALEAN